MTSAELDSLARIGKLKREQPSAREQQGLLQSALARLADAASASLSFDSRFDLAYNAAHAVLHAGRRHADRQQQAQGVDCQVTLASLDLLARVITGRGEKSFQRSKAD